MDNTEVSEELQLLLTKAKIELMRSKDSSFFTTICFSLKFQWDKTIRTAATDGKTIKFNPVFFMSLTVKERVFVLIHESMHVAYLHMTRLKHLEPKKANVAADHVINLQLIERGFTMPKIGLADPQYSGMCVEDVYALLPSQESNDVDMDIQEPTEPSDELQKEVEDILIRASIQSKMDKDTEGSIPGDIQIFLNGLLNPKLPWHRILAKYVNALSKNDYTFKKPNRRFFPQYYLPSLYSESIIDLAIAVDTSGSVTDEEFHVFISEVASIFRLLKPAKITLIQFDTEIVSVTSVKNIKELKGITFQGRGGTFIPPIINWVNTNKPKLMLVFSDGYFSFYGDVVKSPLIWIIHSNPEFTAPFGKVVHYSLKDKK